MRSQCGWLTLILLAALAGGCANERRWTCPEGQCGVLSGRFDGCNTCTNCEACGEILGQCRCHPLTAFKNRITCGEGCGEIYWNEWINDPPMPCDPCDEQCGNFIGRRCCPPPWRKRTSEMLLGRRCCTTDCDGGACGNAGGCADGNCANGSCTAVANPDYYHDQHATPISPTPAPRLAPPPAARPAPRTSPAPADEAPRLNGAKRSTPGVQRTSTHR